jgi:tetratricopeptide (TPR) repeat protein
MNKSIKFFQIFTNKKLVIIIITSITLVIGLSFISFLYNNKVNENNTGILIKTQILLEDEKDTEKKILVLQDLFKKFKGNNKAIVGFKLAENLIKLKKYNQAKEVFENIFNCNCNKDARYLSIVQLSKLAILEDKEQSSQKAIQYLKNIPSKSVFYSAAIEDLIIHYTLLNKKDDAIKNLKLLSNISQDKARVIDLSYFINKNK